MVAAGAVVAVGAVVAAVEAARLGARLPAPVELVDLVLRLVSGLSGRPSTSVLSQRGR